MVKSKKLDKVAKSWMRPVLYYQLYDCSDSMHESEKLEARFDALADDKISIDDYVEKYLFEDYMETLIEVAKEQGDKPNSQESWIDFLENSASSFPKKVLNYKFIK